MRSYTRKRPDNQLIENVHELCRLCLTKAVEVMPIFTEGSDNICATLSLRIMICVGLEVTREDCLPNIICTECYKELDKYYTFRKKCEVTYQKLKSHALAVKEKQIKEKIGKEVEVKPVTDKPVMDNAVTYKPVTYKPVMYKPVTDLEKFVVTFDSEQFSDVNELNLNGVAQANNFVENIPVMTTEESTEFRIPEDNNTIEQLEQNIPVMTTEESTEFRIPEDNNTMEQLEQNIPVMTTEESTEFRILENNNTIEQLEQEAEEIDTSDVDITTFLSSMLIELGILTQLDNGLLYANQNIGTLELETGDGSQLTLEIMEEDFEENQEVEQVAEEVPPPVAVSPPEESEAMTDQEILIKYIESNSRISAKFPSDSKGNGMWCDECGKHYASKSALTRHRRVHSGEKPFVCKHCGRRFSQREIMLRHMLVHEARRPHACSECNKSFTQRAALALHARCHAPAHARALALHRCDRCPKVFLHASGLSRHIMMHNGRVFMCGACERQFKDKSSLLRHLKNSNHALIDNPDT